MKKTILTLFAFFALSNLMADDTIVMPKKFTIYPSEVSVYQPIKVNQPILLDKTDLKGNKFSDETLLAMPINFPSQDKFKKVLKPNKKHFFRLEKPKKAKFFTCYLFM